MKFVNTDVHKRVWPHLTNEATGRTLELEPGEEVEFELASFDEDFDHYLKPVKPASTRGKGKGKDADDKPIGDDGDDKPDEGKENDA